MATFEIKDNHYKHLWDVIPANTAIVKGDYAVRQDRLVFYIKDVESTTEEVCAIYQCDQVEAQKRTGTSEAILSGDKLYLYVSDGKVSPNAVGTPGVTYYYCGTALENADASDTTVLQEFDGTRHTENV